MNVTRTRMREAADVTLLNAFFGKIPNGALPFLFHVPYTASAPPRTWLATRSAGRRGRRQLCAEPTALC